MFYSYCFILDLVTYTLVSWLLLFFPLLLPSLFVRHFVILHLFSFKCLTFTLILDKFQIYVITISPHVGAIPSLHSCVRPLYYFHFWGYHLVLGWFLPLCGLPELSGVLRHYLPDHAVSVSYTHLDVYKRQVYQCFIKCFLI